MSATAPTTPKDTTAPVITYLIVEDDPHLRPLWQRKLAHEPGFVCLGSFADAESALKWLGQNGPPMVALVDLKLPGMPGEEFIRRLKAAHPQVLVLVITNQDDLDTLQAAFAAGADGYMQKPDELADLPRNVRDLLAGRAPLSVRMGRLLLDRLASLAPAQRLAARLTLQENIILEHLATGHPAKFIAATLGISIHTVNTHKKNLYDKLGVHSGTEAVALWCRAQS